MSTSKLLVGLSLLAGSTIASGQNLDQLDLHDVRADATTYRQRKAIHIVPSPTTGTSEGLAIYKGSDFANGEIQIDVAGSPATGAGDTARGFIGIAFRAQPAASKFELIYLRPTNGRADDQLRRNHSTQYESFPEWPWDRLRKETPGLYESYVDLESGAWTKMRIVVSGRAAKLFVNGAAQPCLIVNDLKMAPSNGQIALWVGPGTEGYFANLRIITTMPGHKID